MECTVLVDTSIAIPFVMERHQFHQRVTEVVDGRRLGLAGHAAFETFSVLTRLPAPDRRSASVVDRIIRTDFPDTKFLSEDASSALLVGLAEQGVAGGAVYDALVCAAAVEHGLTLLTRDRRALGIYRSMGGAIEVC